MCCSRIVLPVRGGATIRARWPLPSGVSRSITRVVSGCWPVSSLQPLFGIDRRELVERFDVDVVFRRHAVDVEDFLEPRALAAGGWRCTMPVIRTPSRRPNFSIIVPGTNGSVRSRE